MKRYIKSSGSNNNYTIYDDDFVDQICNAVESNLNNKYELSCDDYFDETRTKVFLFEAYQNGIFVWDRKYTEYTIGEKPSEFQWLVNSITKALKQLNSSSQQSEFIQYKMDIVSNPSSLDDDTSASTYFYNLISDVSSNLGIEFEGSTQAGNGFMNFYSVKSGLKIAEKDYQEWLKLLHSMINWSKTEKQFKSRVKDSLEKICEFKMRKSSKKERENLDNINNDITLLIGRSSFRDTRTIKNGYKLVLHNLNDQEKSTVINYLETNPTGLNDFKVESDKLTIVIDK